MLNLARKFLENDLATGTAMLLALIALVLIDRIRKPTRTKGDRK